MQLKDKLQERARKIKSDTAALYLAFQRKDTPILAKVIIAVTVCYALSPIDLIPDFIPVLGFLDDVLLLPLLIIAAVKIIPAHIWGECREQAIGMWENGKPKKWWYAIPVIVIWIAIIALIVKAIWF